MRSQQCWGQSDCHCELMRYLYSFRCIEQVDSSQKRFRPSLGDNGKMTIGVSGFRSPACCPHTQSLTPQKWLAGAISSAGSGVSLHPPTKVPPPGSGNGIIE